MITEDYVSFETAKLLKEKGFDADITTYRDDFIQHGNIVIPLQECLSKDKIKTPTLQMAMKWLREVHNIHIQVFRYSVKVKRDDEGLEYSKPWFYRCTFLTKLKDIDTDFYSEEDFDTYEQACEAAIKHCLKNLI